MAYVTITKDLTEVKDKVAFGLTKRQIVCFSLGGIAGVGTYFLTRHSLGNDLALLLLIALAAPFMLFGLYEKNGQPLEKDSEKYHPCPTACTCGQTLPDQQPVCRPGAAGTL